MGGIAFRAPVLAALFLIVTLATLAMPGSANFVGEFLILIGVFKEKLVYAIVASAGVVLAAVYMMRAVPALDAQPRSGRGVESREVTSATLLVLAPIVLVILALALYPQLVLQRTEPAAKASVGAGGRRGARSARVGGAADDARAALTGARTSTTAASRRCIALTAGALRDAAGRACSAARPRVQPRRRC